MCLPRITELVLEPVSVTDRYGIIRYHTGICTDLSKSEKKTFSSMNLLSDLNRIQIDRNGLNRCILDWIDAFRYVLYWTIPNRSGSDVFELSYILDHFSKPNRTGSWPVWFGMLRIGWFGMVLKTLMPPITTFGTKVCTNVLWCVPVGYWYRVHYQDCKPWFAWWGSSRLLKM